MPLGTDKLETNKQKKSLQKCTLKVCSWCQPTSLLSMFVQSTTYQLNLTQEALQGKEQERVNSLEDGRVNHHRPANQLPRW